MNKSDPYKVYLFLEGGTAFLFSMIFTASSIYQVTLAHLTPLQLVLVGTTIEVSIFLFEVPTGIVADAFSRRLSIIIGVSITGIAFIVEGLFPIFAVILVAQVLWGLGYTFTSGATQAWITDEIGEARAARAFLRSSQVGSFVSLPGIAMGTLLGAWRINIPIVAGGALFLALGALLALIMPETGFKPTPREDRNSWQHMAHIFREGLRTVQRRPALVTILGIGLFYGLYSEGYDRLWTKLVLDNIAFPAVGNFQPVVWFGLVSGVGTVLAIGAVEVVRRRVDTNNPRSAALALLATTLTIIAGLALFAWSRTFALAAALIWIISMARSVAGPVYEAWVNHRLDSQVRATVLSMSAQVDAIGQVAGGPMVGAIGNWSVRAAITVSGLLLIPAAGLCVHSLNRKPDPQ